MSTGKSIEAWKAIPGFPGYEVSDQGQVRSYWRHKSLGVGKGTMAVIGITPRILKQRKDSAGYMHVDLCRPGTKEKGCTRQPMTVTRLVLMAFVGPPKPGEMALHVDDPDKSDCRLSNLRWGQKPENNGADIVRHEGKHPCSSFTPDDVRTIRRRLAAGELQRVIADDYGVHRSTITLIARRKNHKYIC